MEASGADAGSADRDEWIDRLATLFAEHPAWVEAARRLDPEATSTVHFTHRPGQPWRLVTIDRTTDLLPGGAPDPDLVFRFSPASIARLEDVDGGVGDIAVALFEQIADRVVDLRIVAPFERLARRGYVKLLLAAGPSVLVFGASRGIWTLGALRRLVADLRRQGPADWEQG
jgi:hypothetical protein